MTTRKQTDMETYFTLYNLQIAWFGVKKYWSYVAVVLLFIVLFIVMKQKDVNLLQQIKQISDGYEDQIKKINAARELERKQLEENQRKLEEKLALINKQYEERMIELDNKKKAEVERLVKKYKNDPEKLAVEISKSTGFSIVMPEDNPYEDK
jgi:septal ring factor EnvC (AmiA/AmiB activator)